MSGSGCATGASAGVRFVVAYRDTAGERRPLVFCSPSMTPWWTFHEETVRDGTWRVVDAEQVDAPTLRVEPWGVQSFAGP